MPTRKKWTAIGNIKGGSSLNVKGHFMFRCNRCCEVGNFRNAQTWCLDSGATSHVCKEIINLTEINDTKQGRLNFANDATTVSNENTP